MKKQAELVVLAAGKGRETFEGKRGARSEHEE